MKGGDDAEGVVVSGFFGFSGYLYFIRVEVRQERGRSVEGIVNMGCRVRGIRRQGGEGERGVGIGDETVVDEALLHMGSASGKPRA